MEICWARPFFLGRTGPPPFPPLCAGNRVPSVPFLGQFLGIHQFQHQFQVLIPSSTFHGVVISSFASCVIGGVVVTVYCLVVAMMIGGGVGYGCILVIVVPWGLARRLFRWLALNTASLSHDTDTTSSSIPSRNSCPVRDTVPTVTHKWTPWS